MTNSVFKTIAYGIGNILAWYCYTLFMPFLIIISKNFFSTEHDILVGFAVFGCGLLTRPIGSYIFGRIGDLICREKAVGLSYLLLALSTTMIGLVPSYEKCGLTSSILIVLARALQGVAMGGAGNVSVVQLVEIAPPKYKGLIGCIPNASNLIGLFISNFVFSILYIKAPELWRIPFLFGLVLIAIAILQLREKKCSKIEAGTKISLEIIKKYKLELLCVFVFTAFSATCYYSVFAFFPNYYLSRFGANATNIVTIANVILIVAVFLGGYISDKFGRILVLWNVFLGILLFCGIPLCASPELSTKLLIVFLGMVLSAYYGVSGAFFAALFPSNIRCTAIAVTMSVSQAIFGSSAPLIANTLTSYSFKLVTLPLLGVCVCSMVMLALVRKGRNNFDI